MKPLIRRTRQLFRPVYHGGGMEVRPRHWWSPKDRKRARTAAAVLAHEGPAFLAEAKQAITRSLLYGDPPIVRDLTNGREGE